jgi:hypothetical protein
MITINALVITAIVLNGIWGKQEKHTIPNQDSGKPGKAGRMLPIIPVNNNMPESISKIISIVGKGFKICIKPFENNQKALCNNMFIILFSPFLDIMGIVT